MVAWSRVVSGEMERDVDGFEIYFVGLGGQLDVEGQRRKQSRVISRFLQPGRWWYDLLREGNRDIKRYWDKSKVFRYVKCEM